MLSQSWCQPEGPRLCLRHAGSLWTPTSVWPALAGQSWGHHQMPTRQYIKMSKYQDVQRPKVSLYGMEHSRDYARVDLPPPCRC